MALEHALLVSLAERPSSGYELARRFDKSISFFWSATHQQIYRTLKRITEAGWATFEVIAQDGKPDKKTYSISELGRAELAKWISEPSPPPTVRWELAVKLRGLHHGEPDTLRKELKTQRDEAARILRRYQDSAVRHFPAGKLSGAHLHQRLVLEGGIRQTEGFIAWLDETIEALSPDNQPEEGETSDHQR